MAIKGKKKKARSTARRPAGAPRSIQRPSRTQAWHERTGVRIGIAVAAAVVLIVTMVLINNSRDDTSKLEKQQAAIETFTGEAEALLQRLSPTVAEMMATRPGSKALAEDARRWDRTLTATQEEVAATTVASTPPELDAANRLVFQSLLQYIAAAKTYALVPQAEGKLKQGIAERAGAQVAAADGTWQAAIVVLDRQRTEAELSPSGLRAPSAVAPAPSPTGG